jgi:hypothetical protein
MADINVVYSLSMIDDKGSRATIPIYAKTGDSNTIAAISAAMATFSENFDSVTEGQLISHSLTILLDNPVTWKSAPVANSDVEEGALFSFPLANLPSKSYGIEIPAFNQSMFVDTEVDVADLAVADLITALTTPGALNVHNNVWSNTLSSPVRRAYKTFRKRSR